MNTEILIRPSQLLQRVSSRVMVAQLLGSFGLFPLLAALGLLYWFLQPAMLSGDSIGYLKMIPESVLLPGHLATLPLFRLLARLQPGQALLDLHAPLRFLSLTAALGALSFFFDAARRLHGSHRALAATALLGVSWGFWRSAQEVESYALATFFATAALWALVRFQVGRRSLLLAAAAGLGAGLGTLFHLTLALLGLPLLLLLWRGARAPRRWLPPLVGLLAMMVTAGLPFLLALHHLGLHHPAAAWSWLRSADHGLPYVMTLQRTPLELVAGLGRSLVHAPYPYEASLPRVVLFTAVGVLAWLLLALLARGAASSRSPIADGKMLLAWGGGLGLFGVSFFPADTERWIFILPALLLVLTRIEPRHLAALAAAIAIVNASALLPGSLDGSARAQAAAADQLLARGDLVVHPGHGWDELIGLGRPGPVLKFPFIYFVGAEGGVEPARKLLEQAIARVFARGDRVFVARLEEREDGRGWGMLRGQGIDRDGFRSLLEPYRPQPTSAPGVWELSPPPQHSQLPPE